MNDPFFVIVAVLFVVAFLAVAWYVERWRTKRKAQPYDPGPPPVTNRLEEVLADASASKSDVEREFLGATLIAAYTPAGPLQVSYGFSAELINDVLVPGSLQHDGPYLLCFSSQAAVDRFETGLMRRQIPSFLKLNAPEDAAWGWCEVPAREFCEEALQEKLDVLLNPFEPKICVLLTPTNLGELLRTDRD